MNLLSSFVVVCSLAGIFVAVVCKDGTEDISRSEALSASNLEQIRERLATHDARGALDLCSKALGETRKSAELYLLRAAAYMMTGRVVMALRDLDEAILLEPDCEKAYLSRARVNLRLGDFDNAAKDLTKVSASQAQAIKDKIEETRSAYSAARVLYNNQKYPEAIAKLAAVFESSPEFVAARSLRADALIRSGELRRAIVDLQREAQTESDNSETHFTLAKILLVLGDDRRAKEYLDMCAQNEEHKACRALRTKCKAVRQRLLDVDEMLLHPSVAALEQLLEEFDVGVRQTEIYYDERLPSLFKPFQVQAMHMICSKYLKLRNGAKAKEWCEKAERGNPNAASRSEEYLRNKAEISILLEDFEEAVRIYESLRKQNPRSKEIHDASQRAHKLLKESKTRDYYGILGVSKDASKKDVQRAYRKMAQQWHPDKHKGDAEIAKKKILDINMAYEVLADDQKRQQYDMGLDPNDPHAGQGNVNFNGGGFKMSPEDFMRMFGGGGFHQQQRPPGGGNRYHKFDDL